MVWVWAITLKYQINKLCFPPPENLNCTFFFSGQLDRALSYAIYYKEALDTAPWALT